MSRRTRNPLAAAFAKHFAHSTVTHSEPVTPTMQRIRLVAEQPITFPYTPGQHIRVQINDPLSISGILRPGETLRTYTIWDLHLDERAIELRVHLYPGDGIGLAWAQQVRPGDPVTYWWPKGDFYTTNEAAYHVFLGEETASAAFGPMIRALDPSAPVYGVLESESPEHDLPMPGRHELARVYRHGASAVASQALLDGVADLALPEQPGMAYVAGEARTCQLIRNFLVQERNWPRTAIKVKPFWAVGKPGLH
ncbi:siderophore-interacting protein [Phytoactinopolyspora limicola]|uniref:siderophore-interacting protein n=1 Tax=Phytoactinopolyspora limicola TaxID=2715536 RepID=UPI001A9C3C3F|nr:siderophore-interacting protein [Phytoactinopolyspora limicola]